MRVIIAAGGTGGHLYPGVALAREFARMEPGSEAIFVGTVRGLETKVVPREGFELITITAQGVMGRGVWGALQGLAAVPVGLLECLAICRRRRPDLAIGLGGYTSPPLVLAAFLLGVKRAILEPNVHPGVANRVLSPFANLVFVSFADTAPFFAPEKTRIVGTPIRQEFLASETETRSGEGKRGHTLLVLGGSQGARSVNRAMVAALPRLLADHPTLRVIHQTGERDYEEVVAAYRNAGPPTAQMEVVPFLFDVPRDVKEERHHFHLSGRVPRISVCGNDFLVITLARLVDHPQRRMVGQQPRQGSDHRAIDGPGPLAASEHQERVTTFAFAGPRFSFGREKLLANGRAHDQ